MIQIKRSECPRLLSQDSRWDSPRCKAEVVDALYKMQHGKCCYCEKKIAQGGHEQAVDHFRPKAPDKFPELENTWTNMLHACSCCNGKKANNFPTDSNGNALLIDPADPAVDPEDHLGFNVNDEDGNFGRISPKDNSEQGLATIETIGLDLPRKRHERKKGYIRFFSAYIDIATAEDDATRNQKIQAFENMLLANNEHAAFTRAFAKYKGIDSRFGVKMPVGADVG